MSAFRGRFPTKYAARLSGILLLPFLCMAQGPQFDGPAELPRAYVDSAMHDTPAPGKHIAVRSGDNLQAAIDSANCGDTLELEAGAAFSGVIRFPEKPCDDAHWL